VSARVTIASRRAHHGDRVASGVHNVHVNAIASAVTTTTRTVTTLSETNKVPAPPSRRGQARHHGSAPRIDPRPRAIISGGITRKGDAINIRLTDWTEHGPVLTSHGGHCAASRAVTACIPPGDGFLPSQAARQLEPGASNRNGSHRHITITARTGAASRHRAITTRRRQAARKRRATPASSRRITSTTSSSASHRTGRSDCGAGDGMCRGLSRSEMSTRQ
jgi:hypothetical protein